jgi:hypothetical protein
MSSTTPGPDPERPYDSDDHESPESERETSSHEEPEPEVAAAAPDTAPDAAESSEPAVPVEPAVSAEPVEPVEPVETPDATARLDAAVERANAVPMASDVDDSAAAVPEPVPADSDRREAYVPSATVATGAATGAAPLAPEPELYVAPQPGPQTVYVQAPTPPRPRGNRGFGVLVALIGTVLFALLYAGVAYLLLLGQGDAAEATSVFTQFLTRPVFWVPIVAFFLGFAILAAIVNRGAWWYYAVFGLLVAVLVYFGYLGGALLTVEAWTLTADEAREFIDQRWLDPFAVTAFIIANEIPIWLGGWIAARGRTVTEHNRLAREAYDRELAAGPQPQRP